MDTPHFPIAEDWTMAYREDASITSEEDGRLRHLLRASFPYQPVFHFRRHLLVPPSHRWLVLGGNRKAGRGEEPELIGHLAVYEKRIGTTCGDLLIGGVAEVCVAAPYRGRGVLKKLLSEVHCWLAGRDFPFAMLFGRPKVYKSSGYELIQNELLASNSLSRHWNPFCGKPLVCKLSTQPWPEGMIDLRGPTF